MSSSISNLYQDSRTDFNTIITKAEECLSTLNTENQENQKKFKKILEIAYKKLNFICRQEGTLPAELTSQAGGLFSYYGMTILNQPIAARNMFLLSISVQLDLTKHYRPIKTIQECFRLEWLPLNLTRQSESQQLELCGKIIEYLPDTEIDRLSSLPNAFSVAKTMRFLLGCCYKIEKLKKYTQKNVEYLEDISRSCMKILYKLETKKSHIISDIFREKSGLLRKNYAIFKLANPKDHEGALKKLDAISYLLNSKSYDLLIHQTTGLMKADIEGLKSKETAALIPHFQDKEKKLCLLNESIRHSTNAYLILENTHFINPVLKYPHLHRILELCLKSTEICSEKKSLLSQYAQTLFNYVKYNKAVPVQASYSYTTAKCFSYLGDSLKVLECLETAQVICSQFPDETKEIAKKIAECGLMP